MHCSSIVVCNGWRLCLACVAAPKKDFTRFSLPADESAAMQATAGGIPEWRPVVGLLGCEQRALRMLKSGKRGKTGVF